MNRYDELNVYERTVVDRVINSIASAHGAYSFSLERLVRFTREELTALAFPDSHAPSRPGV